MFFSCNLGVLGVYIFFTLSGFLVMHSFMTSRTPTEFFLKRALRIFPGLFVVIGLSTFVLGPLVTILPLAEYFRSPVTWHHLQHVFIFWGGRSLPGLFSHNAYPNLVNIPLWTLPYEVVCYLLLATAGCAGIFSLRKFNLKALLIFSMMSFLFGHSRLNAELLSFGCVFAMGAVLYLAKDRLSASPLLAVCCAAGIMLLHFLSITLPDELLGIAFSYLVIYAATLQIPALNSFGKYGDFSYGMYIYGCPVEQTLAFLHGGKMNPYLDFFLAVPVTLLFAFLSWHLVEKRCMALKKHLSRHLGDGTKICTIVS